MRHFHFRTLDELEMCASKLGAAHVGFEHQPERVREILARPVRVGGFTAGNSLAIHPMEGCDGTSAGCPGELTKRRYRRFAAGGAKLIWFEATAVRGEARANPRQLWLNRVTLPDFARLLEDARREHARCCGTADDLLDVLQLAHSGRYSVPRRIIASHHPVVDRRSNTPADWPVISDDELERLEDGFVEAARLASAAGFRAVDLKSTHGYLLSELLSAKEREGRYGGPLENRARFLRNVIGKIRAALGSRLLLCARLGCYDGVPFVRDPSTGLGTPMAFSTPYCGFGTDSADPMREDLAEVKRLIGWLKDWGVELLNISLGSPYTNPHIGRPFEKPDEGNYEQPEHPLLGVERHFRVAGELQRAFPDLPMVGTGYSWLQQYMINAAACNIERGNISFMGAGRAALPYPDFAKDALETGRLNPARVCKTLTYCTYLMRQKKHPLGQFPAGCVPFDKEVYGPIMKQARESQRG
jgi:2,4-dienoyl-CoA reductase-like NADH-dependent reductase (Old Yellow Enzyme family)